MLDGAEATLAVRTKTVDVSRADLRGGFMALVIAVDAIVRVGEPDRAIRVLNHVIGAVQPTTVI